MEDRAQFISRVEELRRWAGELRAPTEAARSAAFLLSDALGAAAEELKAYEADPTDLHRVTRAFERVNGHVQTLSARISESYTAVMREVA